MNTEEKDSAQAFEFKAEIQQLLNILVHSLYTEREIFVRELLSNASDALHRIQFEMLTNREVQDAEAELKIHIQADKEARTLIISDTGIGMTSDEIMRDLGTIAHSGAAAFLKQLEEQEQPTVELIGQFGVGFYSVFMAAEKVRVVSRSYRPDAEAVEWISDGGSTYQLGPAEKPERGTRIEISLKEDQLEFADEWRLEQIIKKHSDFIAFPIYVGDKTEPSNRQTAPWRQLPRDLEDSDYAEFYKHLTLDFEDPLLYAHLVTDAPVNMRSILYVPSRREGNVLKVRTDHGLKLYIRNVLIQEYNKDLLPNYLRFVEGVVESEDLPLNISRETVQNSPVARRVQKALVRKVIKELESLAEDEPQKYQTFWDEFGAFVKEGIATEPAAQSDLLSLLRFHSTKSDGQMTSLAEYVERMTEGQEAIYYVLGQDLASVTHSPHLDYYRAHNIEVLFWTDPIDSFMAVALQEYKEKPLRNVDEADIELPSTEEEQENRQSAIPDADFNRVVGRFVQVLGDRVVEVKESKVLHDNPCRLVSPKDAPMQDMARVYRMLGQEYEMPKRILEINRQHPIIANLARLVANQPNQAAIDSTIEQLFENQLLLEGLHPNPAEMIPRIHDLLQAATGQSPD